MTFATHSTRRLAADLDLNTDTLATGPYSRMSTRFRKSFFMFGVEIVDVRIRFGMQTADRLEAAARSNGSGNRTVDRLAEIALRSEDALVEIHFLRPVNLGLFLGELKRNSRAVYECGLIDLDLYQEIASSLTSWYSFLNGRGVRANDRMIYRIEGEGFRVVYQSGDARVLFDRCYEGPKRRLAILGAYFHSGSEFRNPLIRSVLA